MAETKKFGYARVSSKEQSEGRQIEKIKIYVKSERDIYVDKVSGRNFDRPQYQILKNQLRNGDEIYISSLDRLGRNYELIKKEWADLNANGIYIRVLDMPILNEPRGDLTQKLIADIVLQLLSYVAEVERINIHERQKQGIDLAKKNGIKFGRPKIEAPSEFSFYHEQVTNGKMTAVAAMKEMKLKPNTFYRLKKEAEKS